MNIFIASLPFQLEESDIRELFEDYGEVTSVKLIIDRETGRKRGFGFIEMPNEEEALNAIKAMDKTEIYERTISVAQAQDRKPKGDFSRSSGSGGYNRSGNQRTGSNRDF